MHENISLNIFSFKSIIFFIIPFLLFMNKSEIYIENDNKLSEYEENIDFSKYKTDIKVIALYLPQFHEIEENNKFWGKGFTEWVNVKKCNPRFKGHNQPRVPGDKYGFLSYYHLDDLEVIESQINLAKSHGIYGFGIYYYWFSGKELLEKPINIFLKYSNINFHFLLIWANENWTKKWDGKEKEILIKQSYNEGDPKLFIKDIKKYIKDKRYIMLKDKPIIGLYEPNKIPNLQKTIEIWRQSSREIGIGEIFILICLNNNKTQDFQKMNLFDASYEFPPRNSFQNRRMVTNQTYIYSYTELLYNSYNFNDSCLNNTNFHLFRGAMLEWDNCPRINFCVDFYNYSPQQFYIFNKIIVEWTRKHYKKPYRFIFINAWNEWGEGSYLEPDVNYGYSSINSLSRAIFNISYVQNVYNNIYNFRIAVIAYISNEDSILEIINKIFNIHYEFDLYIFSCVKLNFEKFIPHIKKNSNINAFEIKLVLNRKESLLSYLIDFKTKSRNYKYICNLNVVKYNNISYYEELKNYLLSNLLGDSKIITEIISNFEKK